MAVLLTQRPERPRQARTPTRSPNGPLGSGRRRPHPGLAHHRGERDRHLQPDPRFPLL